MFANTNLVAYVAAGVMFVTGAIAWAAEPRTGSVMAVQPEAIIVMDLNAGETLQYQITPATKIVRKGEPAKATDLAMGDRVQVVADTVDGKLIAKTIDAMPPG